MPRSMRIPAVCLLCWAFCAKAATVVIDVDVDDRPYAWVDDKGEPHGLYPALLSEAFRRMGVPLRLDPLPWNRVMANAEACRAGAMGVYRSEPREQIFEFSRAVLTNRITVYARARDAFEFSGLDSLQGKRIGVRRGWLLSPEFQKAVQDHRVTQEEVNSDRLNFEKLVRDRIDVALAGEQIGDALLKEFPDIHKAAKPFSVSTAHLAFCKASPPADVLSQFNRQLEAMQMDGTLDRLGHDGRD